MTAAAATLDIERVLDSIEPPLTAADPLDPWACEACRRFPATTQVDFPGAGAFEVCGRCVALARIDGVRFTPIADLTTVVLP